MTNGKEIPQQQWMDEGRKLFGEDVKQWKFICPNCENVQTINDFVELNKLKTSKVNPETAYFSCIGRFDHRIPDSEIGTMSDKKSPCNYTLGGLFCLAETSIIDGNGKSHPVFEFAKGAN